ncbi:MAG: membrane dipeptidase [Gemmatimonadales bacterium]
MAESPFAARTVSRREIVRTLAAGIAAPAVLRRRYRLFADWPQEYSERAVRLVRESLVVDLLNQFRFADYADRPPLIERWLTQPGSMSEADYLTYRDSGYTAVALGHSAGSYEAAVKFYADWNGFLAGYPDWFTRIDDAGDFERAKRAGRFGIVLTFQGSDHFRTPADVDTFFALGQRLSQLTYNYQNRIGAGFLEENDGGLTVFGRELVARMQQVGMAVDVSHCGDRTTLDTLDVATRPVVFSHASCRALAPGHLRNKTDEMIRKMARSGGVMGIPFLRMMIRPDEPVTVEHVLDHFDYVGKLVGVEHLAVGSDMDVVGNPNPVNAPTQSVPATPNFERYRLHVDAEGNRLLTIKGLDHPRRSYDLAEGLIRRKYSDADIRGILGGNAVRVLGEIWRGSPPG